MTKALPLNKKIDRGAFSLSVVISGMLAIGLYVLDMVYEEAGETIVLSGVFGKVGLLALMCFSAAVLYFVFKKAFALVDRFSITIDEQVDLSTGHGKKIDLSSFIQTAILILACWLPIWLIRFPGNLDPDTLWQIMQPYGLSPASDHHPWFATLVFYGFWRFGDVVGSHSASILIYMVFQGVASALCISAVVNYIRCFTNSRPLCRAVLVFYCLYPIIPMFSQTMAKDMLFGLFWILFLLMYFEIIRTRGEVLASKPFVVKLLLLLLILMLVKKTSLYIVLLLALPLLIGSSRLYRKRLIVSIGTPVILFCVLWSSIILPAFGIQKGSEAEMLSVPSQQVAYLVRECGDTFTDEDWSTLARVYSEPSVLGDLYTPGRADATKALWRSDSTVSDKLSFIAWYLSAFMEHPRECLISAAAITLPLFYPDSTTEGDESLLFYRDNLPGTDSEGSLEQTMMGFSSGLADMDDLKGLFSGLYRNQFIAKVSDAFDYCLQSTMSIVPILFSKALFATYIPLFVFVYLVSRGFGIKAICYLAPAFVTLLSLAFGPIALPRYMVSVVYVAPLFLAVPFIISLKNQVNSGR